jgi:FAD/FMN-containing dehydrogenase
VGGAIANDIHGKNHHVAGTFGCHVTCFELLRSTGERVVCSPTENAELFRATIGGLGLTGVILWAELRLKRIPGPSIAMERIRFGQLDEFFELSAADRDHEYTVAWVDCLARGERLGRGLYMRGDHAPGPNGSGPAAPAASRLAVPFDMPAGLLNSATVAAFNAVYYRSQLRGRVERVVPYEPFFFPLDGVHHWNRMYGRPGFLQYQCVVPDETDRGPVRAILERISRAREASFLAVLKRFGAVPSPGLLSFPRPGTTLALDFRNRGARTLSLLDDLDAIVRDAGGAVYPAKDARMSGESFRRYFPAWEAFAAHVDPRFSSSFWRRVQLQADQQ